MTDTEKIERLRQIFIRILAWYEDSAKVDEEDPSYRYDEVSDQFEYDLTRGDMIEILELLK